MKLAMQSQQGYFRENCFTLERGQELAYEVQTPHAINFNLHHHRNDGDTVFPDRTAVKSQHSNRIVAEAAGVYCFTAANADEYPDAFEVVIDYEITTP